MISRYLQGPLVKVVIHDHREAYLRLLCNDYNWAARAGNTARNPIIENNYQTNCRRQRVANKWNARDCAGLISSRRTMPLIRWFRGAFRFLGFAFKEGFVAWYVGNCSIAIAIKLCWNSEHQLSIAQRSWGSVAPSTCSRVTSGLLISEALPLSWAHSCSSFEAQTTELWSSPTDCKSSKFLLNLNFLPCFLVQSPQGFLMSPSTESRSMV